VALERVVALQTYHRLLLQIWLNFLVLFSVFKMRRKKSDRRREEAKGA
jgi:hypothetical protein